MEITEVDEGLAGKKIDGEKKMNWQMQSIVPLHVVP